MAPYLVAKVASAPEVPVPVGKRLPRGWQAFTIPPAGSGQAVFLSWQSSGAAPALPTRLRVTVALDEREEKLVEVFLPASGRQVGIFDIRYAHLFQPFEILLAPEDGQSLLNTGCGLRLLRGEQPLWLFHDPLGERQCDAFMPHLVLDSHQNRLDSFLERMGSLASLQFFGWQEGCVLDGLFDLARIYPGGNFLRTIHDHLGQFFNAQGGLQAEDDFSRPADGRVYGIEATLPYAVLAKIHPDHPALEAVVDFWLASRAEDGSVQDKQGLYQGTGAGKALTTEGSYTLAYPMAVLARMKDSQILARMAVEQLRIRRDHLVVGGDIYSPRFADGKLTFRNWSRGVAWYLLGLARTLAELTESERPLDLVQEFRRAADWVISCQLPTGLWPCFLAEPALPADTAGSSGMAAALALGAKLGLLCPNAVVSARRALAALLDHLTPDGFLTSVSQVNKGGEVLQRSSYRVISQMAMGMMAQLLAALASQPDEPGSVSK